MGKRKLYRNRGFMRQLPGGVEYQVPGTNLTRFSGNLHEQGGQGSNSGILYNNDAEVEDGETKGNVNLKQGGLQPYIFSTYLNMDGTKGYNDNKETIADRSIKVAKMGGSQQEIDELARFQEQAAGRSGEKVAKYGGPVQFQETGTGVETDDDWTKIPWHERKLPVDQDYLSDENPNVIQDFISYQDAQKKTDYKWLLEDDLYADIKANGTNSELMQNRMEHLFSIPREGGDLSWEEHYELRALINIDTYSKSNKGYEQHQYGYQGWELDKGNAAMDLYNEYQDYLVDVKGDTKTAFNNDYNWTSLIATDSELSKIEFDAVVEERQSKIKAVWPDLHEEEKFFILTHTDKSLWTDQMHVFNNNMKSSFYNEMDPVFQQFSSTRGDFVKDMMGSGQTIEMKGEWDLPLTVDWLQENKIDKQVIAGFFGMDAITNESIPNYGFEDWVRMGMPETYYDLSDNAILGNYINELESQGVSEEEINAYFANLDPNDPNFNPDNVQMAGVKNKGLMYLISNARHLYKIPKYKRFIKKYGWSDFWAGMNSTTKNPFKGKGSRTKWKDFRNISSPSGGKTFKPSWYKGSRDYSGIGPKNWAEMIDMQTSTQGFIWRHKWNIASLYSGYEITKGIVKELTDLGSPDIRDKDFFDADTLREDTEGGQNLDRPEEGTIADTAYFYNIGIIDISAEDYENAVMENAFPETYDWNFGQDEGTMNYIDQLLQQQDPSRHGKRTGGRIDNPIYDLFKTGGPTQYQTSGHTNLKKLYGNVEDPFYWNPDFMNVQDTIYGRGSTFEGAQTSFLADLLNKEAYKNIPEENRSRVYDPEKDEWIFKAIYPEGKKQMGGPAQYQSDGDGIDYTTIPTTDIASEVYYDPSEYGHIKSKQGDKDFTFTDGTSIKLYGDDHLFTQIGDQGVDTWGSNWMSNANPEILTEAGITSFSDFSDSSKILAYQKAWNAANPDNPIREDSRFGEQTTRTAFATAPTDDPPPPVEKTTLETKNPKDFRWLLPVMGGIAQLIGPLKAQKLSTHLTDTAVMPKTSLERVDFNKQLAGNTADLNALRTYIENTGAGPSHMSNMMAGWSAKRRADIETLGKEAEMNAQISNAEATLNKDIMTQNAENRFLSDKYNADQLTRTDETKLAAWDALGTRVAGMTKDWMDYLAERDKTRAIMGDELMSRTRWLAANPHIDINTEEGAAAWNDYWTKKKAEKAKLIYG